MIEHILTNLLKKIIENKKNQGDLKEKEENIKNINKEAEYSDNKNEKIWPQNAEDEDEQIKLAIKQSEEEAKLMLEKEKEEERQLQQALEESEKENKINTKNYIINDINNDINNNNNIIIDEIKEEEFDEEYGICPITQEYMTNPVITPSGNYYEKTAIINWIEKNHTDPMTRENLTKEMLLEDEEYRKQILLYRKKFNK